MSKPYGVVTRLRDFGARERPPSPLLSRDRVRLVGARRVPDTCLARQYTRRGDENAYEYGGGIP